MRVNIPWEEPRPGRYSLTEWEIDPTRTALLVVDMQRGYVDSDCGVGPDLKARFPDIHQYYYPRLAQTVLPNTLRLREFFRSHGLEVIYTRMGLQLPEGRDLPPWSWRAAQVGNTESSLYPKGSLEYEIVPELAPLPYELVLDKNSASPFASTPLDQILRNMGVENLVITGVLTNVAIESTARDAGDRGYNPIVVEDGCTAYSLQEHEDTLANAHWWVVRSTDQVIQTFNPLLASVPSEE